MNVDEENEYTYEEFSRDCDEMDARARYHAADFWLLLFVAVLLTIAEVF